MLNNHIYAQKNKEEEELKEDNLTDVFPSETDKGTDSGAEDGGGSSKDGKQDSAEKGNTSTENGSEIPSRPARLTLPPLRDAPALPKSPAGNHEGGKASLRHVVISQPITWD